MINLLVTCRLCKKEYEIPVTEEGYQKYLEGAKIQLAFPHLNLDQRELIISQTCPDCWKRLFGSDDE